MIAPTGVPTVKQLVLILLLAPLAVLPACWRGVAQSNGSEPDADVDAGSDDDVDSDSDSDSDTDTDTDSDPDTDSNTDIDTGSGADPAIEEFCTTTCDVCFGGTTPWHLLPAEQCIEECVADFDDCPASQIPEILACITGPDCPDGMLGFAICIAPFTCLL